MSSLKNIFDGIPKKRVAFDLIFITIFSACNATFAYIITKTVGLYLTDKFSMLVAGIFIFTIAWNIEEFIADTNTHMIRQNIECNVYAKYIDRLYTIKPSVLKDNNTGYISGLIEKLVSRQESTYDTFIAGLGLDTTYTIYCTILLWNKNFVLSIILIILYLISNGGRIFITEKFTKPWSIKLSEAEGNKNREFIDTAMNINTVQKMNAIKFIDAKFQKAIDECMNITRKWMIRDESGFMFCKSVAFMYAPIALYVLYLMRDTGMGMGVTDIAFLTSVFIQFPHNTRNLAKGISNYNRYVAIKSKLEDIICEENQRKILMDGDFISADIEDIEYSYVKDKKAVKIVIPEFHVDKGDRICIHGESGQGKTTLLHLLSQEIENDKTILKYVDKDGKEHFTNDERLDCVFIAQDTEMFDMSIRENLTLGRDIDDEILIKYLDAVGMGKWIKRQPNGLDTNIGERGVHVSTGQRQRLNLIRGLLNSDKEVYLMDEPTSNVDVKTEESIIKLIEETIGDKTLIIVTHRDAIMSICNKSYLFEGGVLSKE